MPLQYKNDIELKKVTDGKERQIELLTDILKGGTFLPKTVTYKDIDESVRQWLDKELPISDFNGKAFPTMTLFSNQRFSEYTQTWSYTDTNKNILLNFKTVTRESNPQYGTIYGGGWNIPGPDKFFTMRKQAVLDDNGTESMLVLKMRQPTAVDLVYKASIFTTQYDLVNEFNTMVNKRFNARQCYICPNGHYMAMVLEGISDESSYQIDDRQFYGQTFNIKVMGYVLTEDDYRVSEEPIKRGYIVPMAVTGRGQEPEVEIEDCENGGKTVITATFPAKTTRGAVSFVMDSDMTIGEVKLENMYGGYKFYINDERVSDVIGCSLEEDDEVKVSVTKVKKGDEAKFIIISA